MRDDQSNVYLCSVGIGDVGESKSTCFVKIALTQVSSSLAHSYTSVDRSSIKRVTQTAFWVPSGFSPLLKNDSKWATLLQLPVTSFNASPIELGEYAVLFEADMGYNGG